MSDDTKLNNIHLFAMPSFLTGVARIVDPFGLLNEYNISSDGSQADYDALYSDWKAVGDDIQHAIAEYSEKVRQTP